MYRKNAKVLIIPIIIIVIGFLSIVNAQNDTFRKIEIINVGDNWEGKVDSAINLVERIDKPKYDTLIKYCHKIEFSYADFSTTVPPNTIVISSKDMSHNSINNIASVLVHESNHLQILNNKIQLSPEQEELECYKLSLIHI